MKSTVAIIGAGPAGLTAAYLLSKNKVDVTVLEADPVYVGGIARTSIYKGFRFDIGGHRFFSKSEKIINWWLQFLSVEDIESRPVSLSYQNQSKEFNLPISPATKGKMLIRPRKSRIYYNRSFFDYPLSFNKKTLQNFGFAKLCRIGFSYLRSKLFPLKNKKINL